MNDSPADRCTFTFDPEAWEADVGMTSPLYQDLLDRGEVWHCPHETRGEADRCLFHRPVEEKDPAAVREAFLAKIDEVGRTPKQFIGARFGEFDLDHVVVACRDNHEIDLRHARFEGAVSWRYTIVQQPLVLEGVLFRTRPRFMETEFANKVYLNKAQFEAPARFIETVFSEGVAGYKSAFVEANFHRATFGGPADFSEAHFEEAYFRETQFEALARFKLATFDHVTFSGARFGERLYLDQATLPRRVNVRHAAIRELASLTDVKLASDSCYIDFSETTIPDGRLHLSDDGPVVYDLTEAVLGDVELADGELPETLFDHYRFLHTTFDGFDFGSYREVLHTIDWAIHEIVDAPIPDIRTRSPSDGDLESTYLKAKNGANEIGDTKAAAEFFRKEMLYRRDQYLPTVLDGSEDVKPRLAAAGQWAANTLLNLTSGYGERPSRVIGVSAGTILLFSALFAAVLPQSPYGTPIGHLILSLESFVTLVLGGAENVRQPWVRLLAQIEGFIGAFLIALFVFTLTRSIHR